MNTTYNPEEIKYTPEEVAKSVSAAYDSVNLINELKTKETLTEDETAALARNEEHIRIMMGFEWFVAGLTDLQVTELQAI
jgi:hypothetical protein